MDYGNHKRCWTLGDGYTLGSGLTLGQEIGQWHVIRRRAAARKRKPTFSVFLAKQGDVTEYVTQISTNRRFEDSLHEPNHGSGTITMYDVNGDFAENSQCIIQQGDEVKIWAGFDGDNIPRFTGLVTDPKINTTTHEVALQIADYGWLLKQSQTGGDYSAYGTPKLLIDQLVTNEMRLGSITYENEAGEPTIYTFGNTTLSTRTYWAIIHGATLGIFYIFYFDENGVLQCKRRNGFTDADSDTEIVFTDDNIQNLDHLQMAEIINKKSVAHSDTPGWTNAALGDGLRFGQSTYIAQDELSIARYGERADYEAEELIDGWDNTYDMAQQSVNFYKYPKEIYKMSAPGRPELQLTDRFHLDSQKRNVKGLFVIMGIEEYLTPRTYTQTLAIVSERDIT